MNYLQCFDNNEHYPDTLSGIICRTDCRCFYGLWGVNNRSFNLISTKLLFYFNVSYALMPFWSVTIFILHLDFHTDCKRCQWEESDEGEIKDVSGIKPTEDGFFTEESELEQLKTNETQQMEVSNKVEVKIKTKLQVANSRFKHRN